MTASAKAPKITEAAFQAQVLHLAALKGWRTAHFRSAQNGKGQWRTPVAGDGKGFPDVVLVRERVIFVELKTDTGRVRPEQRAWLDALDDAGAEVAIWRPKDWDEIVEVLS